MKKLFALFLVILFVAISLTASAQDIDDPIVGLWYSDGEKTDKILAFGTDSNRGYIAIETQLYLSNIYTRIYYWSKDAVNDNTYYMVEDDPFVYIVNIVNDELSVRRVTTGNDKVEIFKKIK